MQKGRRVELITYLSKTGAYHLDRGMENQDAGRWSGNKRCFGLFLADGVSACGEARRGAETACRAMEQLMMQRGEYFLDMDSREAAAYFVSHMRYELERKAGADGKPVEEYSSTMACALLDAQSGRLQVFNLGDGLIGGVRNGRFLVLASPDDSSRGCCTTTTADAAARAAVGVIPAEELDSLFLCSDGAWRQMFAGSRLRPELQEMIEKGNYQGLSVWLEKTGSFDDCSFISLDMNAYREEKKRCISGSI